MNEYGISVDQITALFTKNLNDSFIAFDISSLVDILSMNLLEMYFICLSRCNNLLFSSALILLMHFLINLFLFPFIDLFIQCVFTNSKKKRNELRTNEHQNEDNFKTTENN